MISEWTTTNGMKTISFTSLKGLYALNVSAIEKDTYIHMYVSTEQGGPQALQNLNKFTQNIKLIKRQRKKQLTVRWEPRFVFYFFHIKTIGN